MCRRSLQTLLAAVLIVLASGFFTAPASAQAEPTPDLDDATWTSLFVRPFNSYTAVYERTTTPNCDFCRRPIVTEQVEIVVLNGRLYKATDLRTGEPVRNGRTIDAWFKEIREAQDAGLPVRGELNDRYGYPQAYKMALPDDFIAMETKKFTWGAVNDFLLDTFELASSTWAANEPEAYQFEYALDCGFCPPPPAVRISVEGGEVVAIATVDGSDQIIPNELRVTIDDLLERVSRELQQPQSLNTYYSNFRYGYPMAFSSRPSDPLISDGESSFRVTNFRRSAPWPEVQAALDEARPKFTAPTYTLTYERFCFCPNREPIVVRVVDNNVVSVDGEDPRWALTVPLMFDAIQEAITSDVDRLAASFDDELGYPTSYTIDPSFQVADEGYSVSVISLVTEEGPAECGGLSQDGVAATVAGRMGLVPVPDAGRNTALGVLDGPNAYRFDPANYAEFCVNIESPGIYRIDGQVMGPAQNSDSFFVAVDEGEPLVWHLPRSSRFVTATVRTTAAPAEFALKAGEHRVRFYLRETGSLLDSIRFVPQGPPIVPGAGCSSTLTQNAEDGSPNGVFVATNTAIPGESVTALAVSENVRNSYRLNRQNYAEFCVTTRTPNAFSVVASVFAVDGNSNSFWVQVDNNEPVVWHIPVASELTKRRLTAPPLRLDPGEHRIRLFHREDTPVTAVGLEPQAR